MFNRIIISFGKILSKLFKLLNLGDGSTWPGHIALGLNPNFIRQILGNSKTKIIIVAGTNGKTTTSSLIASALKQNGKSVIQNSSGANLLNGIASTLLLHSNPSPVILSDSEESHWDPSAKPQDDKKRYLHADFAIFEVDENVLPLILKEITPDYLVLLNLFRDQLDRYGEINTIAAKWKTAVSSLPNKTTLILNADDPQIAWLGLASNFYSSSERIESRSSSRQARTILFFGTDEKSENKSLQHASDSIYCPNCGNKLGYKKITFSHLGDWYCDKCGLKRPKSNIDKFSIYPLPGIYNIYNTHAAVLTLKEIGLSESEIKKSLGNFKPAFGRQEIINYKNRKVQIFLSKNPTSFNQSFQTISNLGAKNILIVLNDRIPDGRDVSWIWDVDFPNIEKFVQVFVSGDRVYDMAVRLKHAFGDQKSKIPTSPRLLGASKIQNYENLKTAIDLAIENTKTNETLCILPTYSAMLECRKILTGKKIL